jgi:hypothetical protein
MEYTGLPYQFLMDMAQESRYMLDSIVETVIDGIRQEILEQKYIVKKIRYKNQERFLYRKATKYRNSRY